MDTHELVGLGWLIIGFQKRVRYFGCLVILLFRNCVFDLMRYDLLFFLYIQKLPENGKKARAVQTHAHTTGSKSYASRKQDFVDEKGREPRRIEWFELTHKQNEKKSYTQGTITRQFLDEANTKVQEILSTSASSVSMNEVENEVFQQLMHGNKIPKRPIGYGLGVKASAVYGVQELLCSGNSSEIQDNHFNIGFGTLMKQNEELRKKNASLEAKFDQNQRLLLLVLAELKNMKDGPRGLDVDQPNSLQRSSQVPDASSKYSFHK